MRRGRAAVAWGREQVTAPVKDFQGLCLQFVRMCFGLGAVYPSAIGAWDHAQRKHQTTAASTIPRGVPVFWRGGSFGHVAISLGGGLCLSTDVKRRGRVDVCRIDAIRDAWGYQLLGWTEDLNGTVVWTNRPDAPPAPKAPIRNNVTRAREQLRHARRALAIAERFLDATPDEREVAHAVGDSLDRLIDRVRDKLDRLPKT